MPDPATVTLLPLGTIDLAEAEAVARRVAKALALVVDVGKPIALPVGHFDPARSQSSAVKILAAVPPVFTAPPRPAPGTTADPTATRAAALSPAESWGSKATSPAPPPAGGAARSAAPTAIAPIRIGITDADLFTERTDFLFSYAEPERRRAVVSTRRLKEAFWKRKSNPPLQQTRLVREIIGAVALAAGAVPCESPNCAASHAKSPLHVDQKTDRLCPVCERKVRGGSQRV